MLKLKRVYDPPESSDGRRMLVMRLWPRGIRRNQVDEWNRDLAPSRELLADIKHHGLSWEDYVKRYWGEIRPEAIDDLRRRARRETITLLCSCQDENHCHRGLLRDAVAKNRPSLLGRVVKKGRSVFDRSSVSRRRASSGSRARGGSPRARRGGRPGARS